MDTVGQCFLRDLNHDGKEEIRCRTICEKEEYFFRKQRNKKLNFSNTFSSRKG